MTAAPLAPYGPNTPAIRRFLVGFAALGKEQRAAILADYRRRAETVDWLRAETVLAATMEASGRSDITDTLAGPLLQLVGNGGIAAKGSEDSVDPIGEPALAALLALAVRELLPPEHFATLYQPFADVIGHD